MTESCRTEPAGEGTGTKVRPVRSRVASSLYALRNAFASLEARRGMFALVDQAVVSVTGLVTSVLIGRTSPPEILGAYFLVLNVVLILRTIQEQVVSTPYAVLGKSREGDPASYAGNTLVLQFLLAAALVGVTVGALAVLAGQGQDWLGPVAWGLLAGGWFMLLRDHLRQFSFAHFRLGTAILLDATVALVQLGGLWLVLRQAGSLDVPTVYVVIGAASALGCLVWLVDRPYRWVTIDRKTLLGDWGRNWAFGKWALASQSAGSLASWAIPWALAYWHGKASTALLAAGYTLVGPANLFTVGVGHYLTPRAAQAYADGGGSALSSVLWVAGLVYAAVLGGFLVFTWLFGEWFAVTVFGSRYVGSGPVVVLLAANLLIQSVGLVAGNGLFALHQPRANFLADGCMAVCAFSLGVWLIPAYDVWGAALALLAGSLVGSVVRLFTLVRLLRSSGPR